MSFDYDKTPALMVCHAVQKIELLPDFEWTQNKQTVQLGLITPLLFRDFLFSRIPAIEATRWTEGTRITHLLYLSLKLYLRDAERWVTRR